MTLRLLGGLLGLLVTGCVGVPKGVTPVGDFELSRYLGKWYEIARLDNRFERGLKQVSADYTPRDDGGLRVLNRGYDPAERRWREAEGRAYFVESPDIGRLRVSFFWPFYGAYNVIALDRERYAWALVCGADRDLLWILARSTQLEPQTLSAIVAAARDLGFATDQLIYVEHSPQAD